MAMVFMLAGVMIVATWLRSFCMAMVFMLAGVMIVATWLRSFCMLWCLCCWCYDCSHLAQEFACYGVYARWCYDCSHLAQEFLCYGVYACWCYDCSHLAQEFLHGYVSMLAGVMIVVTWLRSFCMLWCLCSLVL